MQNETFFPDNEAGNAAAETALAGLNPAQRAAVEHGEGPLLVIAGAGSGKTRTLVHRVAHLAARGVAPESILLLTFTRRAAQNMLFRAAQLTGAACKNVTGGTFHAVANLLLRRYGAYIGIASNFSIIDRADAENIINLLKSLLGLSGSKEEPFPTKRLIFKLISGAVNRNLNLEEMVIRTAAHLADRIDDFLRIAEHYREFKQDHGLMDYDDLLLNWLRLLDESEAARTALSDRFRYILVDEYQDTNRLQAAILRRLAFTHDNVMAVGDDAQSIYSFRGADFANIMRFEEQFPGAKRVMLEQNYRSTRPILDLGNEIMSHAEEKFDKALFTEKEGGTLPILAACLNEEAEARFVADKIEELAAQGLFLNDMAVLFRSAFHSFRLEMELASRGIVFEKRGGLKLTESAHTKDLLAFFRVTVNLRDELSWDRLLLHLPKVGPKTAQKIRQHICVAENPLEELANYPAGAAWKKQLQDLLSCLTDLQDTTKTSGEHFDRAMLYYKPIFQRLYYDDYPKRSHDLAQLKSVIMEYATLSAFVDDIVLDPPDAAHAAHETQIFDPAAAGGVVLSTIHSAKGLEWNTVFVISLAEGRFPNAYALLDEQHEEERRLFYVAVTRAKQRLFLSYSREIDTPDRRGSLVASLSTFVAELRGDLYRSAQSSDVLEDEPTGTAASVKPTLSTAEVCAGMRVHTHFFGEGTVIALPGASKVEVIFDRHGRKLLDLDFAKLTAAE